MAEQASDGVQEAAGYDRQHHRDFRRPEKAHSCHHRRTNKKFVPVPVAENLSWEEFSRIGLHLPYLPGVQADPDGQTRDYPFGDQMVHILGYVASVSPEDKQRDDDPLLDVPGYRIGKRGIEKAYEKDVRGQAGGVRDEVDARGRVIRELGRDRPANGQDVWLTIDGELQKYAAQCLSGESAACVVMDATNGDVLALATRPGLRSQLNSMSASPAEQWRELTTEITSRCSARPSVAPIRPALRSRPPWRWRRVDNGMDDLAVVCTGSMRLGDHTFYCDAWRIGGHGHVDSSREHPGLLRHLLLRSGAAAGHRQDRPGGRPCSWDWVRQPASSCPANSAASSRPAPGR